MQQPTAGDVLSGRYRLVAPLGQGGMGAVWRAEHVTLGSPVAVKLIHAETASSPDAQARFLREAQAAAALRSPHVVTVLDSGVEDGVPFIAMELLEGESLAQRLARTGALSAADTERIVTHVARAIQRAHEAGIVHRDLKPDNVFLVKNADEEIAKVLDFGIAKTAEGFGEASAATHTGAVLGSPHYMSPEQARGTRAVDHRSDLWALGVIAFQCLTGRRPFEGAVLGDLLLKICAEPIPVPSTIAPVPPGFDAWFARATERDPNRRFQSAWEMADALRGAAPPPSLPAASMVTLAPAQPKKSSHALAIVLVLAGLGLFGIGGLAAAFLLLRSEDAPEPVPRVVSAAPVATPAPEPTPEVAASPAASPKTARAGTARPPASTAPAPPSDVQAKVKSAEEKVKEAEQKVKAAEEKLKALEGAGK